MEKVYEEMDEAKAEIEKLKEELRAKTDSFQNLKTSHDAQLNELKEAKFKIEKLDQELLQKEDEINDAKRMSEDINGNLNDKESIIKHLSDANDKLRADCKDKFRLWEEEKKELALVLDEANEKKQNQEQQLNEYQQEIERLKWFLEVSNAKNSEIQKNMNASTDQGERDDMVQKLEEEKRIGEEQLKWKKEQFQLLEEAHEKLKDQFKSNKNEWELEKSTLLEEISSLQNKLDSQITTSEDLQHQLHICNHALAAEQSQRKHPEVEVSNFKDKEVEDLKSSLEAKEAHYKELKNKIEKLEKENHRLRKSLRELQEAQIKESAASYALPRLRSELRNLERIHRECVANFRARQAEWSFQLKQLTEAADSCQSELQTKTEAVENLMMELERSHSLISELILLNEELSVMLLVFKQGISEAESRLFNDDNKMELTNRGREEKFHQLIHQSEMKDAASISAQKDINGEFDNTLTMELQHSLPNGTITEMLEESTESFLKEKALQMEIDAQEQLMEAYNAWDRANIELDGRLCEIGEMEFELEIWKSIGERMKNDLEENLVIRQELENALLAQVEFSESLKQKIEEKENSMDYLQEQVVSLKQKLKTREAETSSQVRRETAVPSETDEVRYLQIKEEKDKALEDLQEVVVLLEQEFMRREPHSDVTTKSSMKRTNEQEKEKPDVKVKHVRIDELMQRVTLVEEQFANSLSCCSSQLAEKQEEINRLQEACDNITAAEILAALEIEEKKLMITELEDDIHHIEQKLKLQERIRSQSKQLALDVDAEMDAKKEKIKEFADQMENNHGGSDAKIQELQMENRNLHEIAARLSSEKEKLLTLVMGLGDKMSECTTTDTQLMDMLRSTVQSFESDRAGVILKNEDGFET